MDIWLSSLSPNLKQATKVNNGLRIDFGPIGIVKTSIQTQPCLAPLYYRIFPSSFFFLQKYCFISKK